jgi:hypothetical protein
VKKLTLCIVISGSLFLAMVLILNVRAQPLASPTVSAITPNTGPADQQTSSSQARDSSPPRLPIWTVHRFSLSLSWTTQRWKHACLLGFLRVCTR